MFGKEEKKKGAEVIGYIGQGMKIEGRLTFDNTVRIEGTFKGDIDAKGTLVIGEAGFVEGLIKVDVAIITGEVSGTIEAISRVEIQSPGKVFGDIKTPNLIIGEGAVFEGNCVMVKRLKPVEDFSADAAAEAR